MSDQWLANSPLQNAITDHSPLTADRLSDLSMNRKKNKTMKRIKIYTKDYCPYCDAAKRLLKEIGASYEEVDITKTPEMIYELVEKSGLMTVPQIFVGDKCLGGYDDIAELHRKGKLTLELA